MTSEQQRGIEEAIIEGRLVDAVRFYREATGCELAEAEAAVRSRSAALRGAEQAPVRQYEPQQYATQPSASQQSASQAAAAIGAVMPRIVPILIFAGAMALIPIGIAVFVFIGVARSVGTAIGQSGLGSTGNLATLVTAPGKLGGAMLRREPFYPIVVKDIQNDPNFRAALGSPIVIDEDGISCRTIRNGYTSRNANCTLPVRGPTASGNVTVAVADQPGSFGVAGELTTSSGRSIDMVAARP